MNFSESILAYVADKQLLKHPFYQAWDAGKLTPEMLGTYARQYYHHVRSFPRYLSATHSRCPINKARRVLLENLIDEERGRDNHPELWLRFAEGIGQDRQDIESEKLLPKTFNLMKTFHELCSSSYPEGLAALYVYEQQTPKVAETKICGLKKHYNVSDERTLQYFTVHQELDIHHTAAFRELVDELPEDARPKAREAGKVAADALWGFLDGMQAMMQ